MFSSDKRYEEYMPQHMFSSDKRYEHVLTSQRYEEYITQHIKKGTYDLCIDL